MFKKFLKMSLIKGTTMKCNYIHFTKEAIQDNIDCFIKRNISKKIRNMKTDLDSNVWKVSASSLLNKRERAIDLVIVRPDKGNGIFILDKIDYINNVELLLSDVSKFKKLDVDVLDLCIKREGQPMRFLWDTLVRNKSISEYVYHDVSHQGSKHGIFLWPSKGP